MEQLNRHCSSKTVSIKGLFELQVVAVQCSSQENWCSSCEALKFDHVIKLFLRPRLAEKSMFNISDAFSSDTRDEINMKSCFSAEWMNEWMNEWKGSTCKFVSDSDTSHFVSLTEVDLISSVLVLQLLRAQISPQTSMSHGGSNRRHVMCDW